jgi:hypothetical protein
MEFRDAAGGQFQRSPFDHGQRIACRPNFFGTNPNPVRLKLYPIKASSQAYQRTIAAAAYLRNYFGDGAVNGIATAAPPPGYQFQEPLERRRIIFK